MIALCYVAMHHLRQLVIPPRLVLLQRALIICQNGTIKCLYQTDPLGKASQASPL